MPKLLLEVPDTEASTARPVTIDIIRQVMKATGIDKDTTILYPSEEEEEAQLGSRIGDNGEKNKFTSGNKVIVDVEEEYQQDRILASAVYRPETNFIFLDQKLGVYIKPVYTSTEVTINFRFRARNKILARRWRDDIKNRSSMMRDILLHTVSYNYLLPLETIYILKEIHRLRENQAGYGEDFDTYFKNNSTNHLSLLTNLAGTQDAWSIAETQQRIQGWFEFEAIPETGSKENDTDAWTTTFSYKFRYEKAIACVIQYPLMIHNQVLSNKFRDSKTPYELEHQQRSYSMSTWFLGEFEKNGRLIPNSASTGLAIPEVDDFIPGQVLPKTARLLTALVRISETDKRTLLDLKQLGKYKFVEQFINFLKSEAPYVTKPYGSIIQVTAYRNTNIIPSNFVTVSNDGIVSVTDDLDLRDHHHVRVSLCTDLTDLTDVVRNRLRENGCAFRTIMAALFPHMVDMGLLPISMCKDNYTTRDQLLKITDENQRYIRSFGNHQDYQFNTVMSLYVQAYRMETENERVS